MSTIGQIVLIVLVGLTSLPLNAGDARSESKVLRATSIPSALLADKKEFQKAVMNEFYGTFTAKADCWISKVAEQSYCMKPHRLDVIGTDKNQRFYLVVSGQKLEDDGTPQNFHAAPGILGLLILTESGTQFGIVAENSLYEPVGSFGTVPPSASFAVREIGPGLFGWIVQNEGFSSGIQHDVNLIYAPVGDNIPLIGVIPSQYTEGEAACVGKRCADYLINLVIDATARNVTFYPLVLRAAGTKSGRLFNKTYRVPFDQSSFRYLVPREIGGD